MPVRRSVIRSCGASLPCQIVTNDDLVARGVDTTDSWIVQRTGIKQRHIANEQETTSALAVGAARQALEKAGLGPDDLDLVIVATMTPELTMPATAARVQAELGMTHGFAFDIQAACSGFVYALGVADSFIKTGQVSRALVIGAETLSRVVDWSDRSTCVLFGDGAGAIILEAQESAGGKEDRGIHSVHLHADGRYTDILHTSGGPGSTASTGTIQMMGKEVYRHAVTCLASVVDEAFKANDMTVEDVDFFIPHQANLRIIEGTAKKLKLAADQVIVTVDQHANTSAASIPLALAYADAQGRLKKGDMIILDGMGGGLTWGAAVLRW